VIHGLFMILERVWLLKKLEKLPVIISSTYLIFFILFTWVLFKAETISSAGNYLSNMFNFAVIGDLSMLSLIDLEVIASLVLGLSMAFGIHNKILLFLRTTFRSETYLAWQCTYLLCVLLLCIMYVSIESYNPFIYYRF